jgi:hypothetical protein
VYVQDQEARSSLIKTIIKAIVKGKQYYVENSAKSLQDMIEHFKSSEIKPKALGG